MNTSESIFQGVIVSAVKSYHSTSPATVPLLNWLNCPKYKREVDSIRAEPDKEKRDAMKAKLPAITPSGLFEFRKAEGLIRHSGFVAFDIDFKENSHIGNYESIKEQLSHIPQVAYCGLSVSGTGYWGLLPIAYPDKHKQHVLALQRAFRQLGINIDSSCKDVCRLRGYSYDPEAYINHNAKIFTVYDEPIAPKVKKTSFSGTDDGKAVESCLEQIEAAKIDITGTYLEWFDIGCSLANAFKEEGRNYFHRISQFHPQYDRAETDRQFNNCLKGYEQIHIGTFFHHCRQFKIKHSKNLYLI